MRKARTLPHGEDSSFSPFWKGKQGSRRKD
jgi:hypothetical protein